MSFSIAASELNVTQSAISRQIKTLEDFLGIELFKRLPRSLELTEGGARFAEPLHDAFDQLYEATETVLHPRRPATLNINVLPTFAMKWLIPRLLHFTAANPNIQVRMITSIRPADFRMDDNDIAVRVAPFLPPEAPHTSSSFLYTVRITRAIVLTSIFHLDCSLTSCFFPAAVSR